MSFSSKTKDELAGLRFRDDAARCAALAALTHTAGSILLGRRGMAIEYVTENRNVGNLIAQLSGRLFSVEASLSIRKHERLNAENTVVNLSGPGCGTLLETCGCLPSGEAEESFEIGHIPETLLSRTECMQSFLRGAFLGSGSVSDPTKGYHLEIVCRQERFAEELSAYMAALSLNAKT